MVTNQINYTDNELRRAAFMVLTEHFGHADTLRFLALQHDDATAADYMELRERLFEGLSARDLFQQASVFWQQRQTQSDQ